MKRALRDLGQLALFQAGVTLIVLGLAVLNVWSIWK